MIKLLAILAFIPSLAFGTSLFDYPKPTPGKCSMFVLIESAKDGIPTEAEARKLCEPWAEYCAVRKYDTGRWEAHLRVKKVFEGSDTVTLLDSFTRFLRRSRFLQNDINVFFTFENCKG